MNTWINCSSGSYRFVSISTVYSSYSCRNKTTQISILPILVPSARKCKYDSLYWSWSNWIIELRWPSHVIWNYTVSLEWNFIISHGAFIQNLAQWCKDSIIETHLSLLWGVQWRQMWYLHPPHTHTQKKNVMREIQWNAFSHYSNRLVAFSAANAGDISFWSLPCSYRSLSSRSFILFLFVDDSYGKCSNWWEAAPGSSDGRIRRGRCRRSKNKISASVSQTMIHLRLSALSSLFPIHPLLPLW